MFPTIVQAPMAGGATTPELVHAVSTAGGFGFLAAGYLSSAQLEENIAKTKALGTSSFGVNLFVPSDTAHLVEEVNSYETKMQKLAKKLGTEAGTPRYSDDEWDEKIRLLLTLEIPYVSFTFGCPSKEILELFQQKQIKTIVTVTTLAEAQFAIEQGADGLCVQGLEAGGHRGSFEANQALSRQKPLRELLNEIREVSDLPLIASGGIMDGREIKELIALGASAVQLGTAFLCCPESGASALHKECLQNGSFTETQLTHAYTGRPARGLANPFMQKHEDAPHAYPELHYLTQPFEKKPLRTEMRK